MSRTDLSKRIAALTGAVAVVSGTGMLLPAIADAATGEFTVTYVPDGYGSVKKKTTYFVDEKSPSCISFDKVDLAGDITIVNKTDKPVVYYNGNSGCNGEDLEATLAAGDSAKFVINGNYELSFLLPPSNG